MVSQPMQQHGHLSPPVASADGSSSPYSNYSWGVPELVADEDGAYPDVRDLYESQSPFEISGSSSPLTLSNSGSPRDLMGERNEAMLRHLAKKGKTWKLGARGTGRFLRQGRQWCLQMLETGITYPIMEDAGALSVEFTPRSLDYIMEIGDSADDSSEYIVWKGNGKPLSPEGAGTFKYNSPRMWISVRSRSDEERALMILNESKYHFMSYESTVIEVIKTESGRDIMWSTVPKGLKNKYNCTDLKTIGQWRQVQDYGMDLSLLKPGMKIKMVIMGAMAGGKYQKNPQLNGVPDPMLWGHYIMSQVGPEAFSQGVPSIDTPVSKPQRTFPRVKSKRKPMKRNVKVSATRFARPAAAKQAPPKISDEESFPTLGSAPKPKSPKTPVKTGIWGRGNAAKKLSSSKFNYATVLSATNEKPKTLSGVVKKSATWLS